jgi:hypothetical protein
VSRARAAVAGAAAATIWAAAEPIDTRLFRHDFSNIALLGKFWTRSRWWPLAGLAIHAANGVVFGLAYDEVRRRTRLPPRPLALWLALAEHSTLYPLAYLVDTRHPARGERGLAPMFSARGFAQETLRHVLFGMALGRLAE